MGMHEEQFLCQRLSELRIRMGVSEHKMSLELGKSGSYIRNISNGVVRPSMREFFNILEYLEVTPAEFFRTMDAPESEYVQLCERLREFSPKELEKVETVVQWIEESHKETK